MTSEELVMLSAACVICNRSVPIYLLEKHHGDHMKNKEQEDKEHAQMLSDMTVIRVKRRVPAKKENKEPEVVKAGEEVFALTPKSKATMASYAGDYDVKKILVNTMLKKSTPGLETKSKNRTSMEAQVKLDMRLGINMDTYTDLDFEGKVEMCKVRAKLYSRPRKTLSPRKFLLKKSIVRKTSETAAPGTPKSAKRKRQSLA